MYLLGDPVDGKFAMFFSQDAGQHWFLADDPGREAAKDAGAFAASNSSFAATGNAMFFGAGATAAEGPKVYRSVAKCPETAGAGAQCALGWEAVAVPLAGGSTSAGVFSLAARTSADGRGRLSTIVLAVGGDYTKPGDAHGTAAYSLDGGAHWLVPAMGLGGYRSAVAYSRETGDWIAVGPTGTDLSKDDGKNWTKVTGEAASGWNAISLPFAVGGNGKIGKLRDGVLP
jgi:hypothetical protein